MSTLQRRRDENRTDSMAQAPTWRQAWLIGALVLSTSLLGILTQPVGFLAAFWPANAMLRAVMVRYPSLSNPWGWLAAVAAYLAVNLWNGNSPEMTFLLTTANVSGAAVGVFLFRRLSEEDRQLQRPLSVLYLLLVCAASGLTSGLLGGTATTLYFANNWSVAFLSWFVGELVNDLLLLPVILTLSPWAEFKAGMAGQTRDVLKNPRKLAPVGVLLASVMVSVLVGGPGAVILPVPALLWCALSYNLFTTALVTCLYCSWTLIAISSGMLLIHPITNYVDETTSIRLGTAFLALAPLSLASINLAREQLVKTLERAVNHDFLTDALARRAFLQQGSQLMGEAQRLRLSTAVIMLDIDRFKGINDRYGHSAGDQVLVQVAATVRAMLRERDLFGRLGGEEFAVVLPNVQHEDALAIAERVRIKIEESPYELSSGEPVKVSVSIGVTFSWRMESTLEQLLSEADQALYVSKHSGRNRVTIHPGCIRPRPLHGTKRRPEVQEHEISV